MKNMELVANKSFLVQHFIKVELFLFVIAILNIYILYIIEVFLFIKKVNETFSNLSILNIKQI